MKPEQLPRQRVYEVLTLPQRPGSFHCRVGGSYEGSLDFRRRLKEIYHAMKIITYKGKDGKPYGKSLAQELRALVPAILRTKEAKISPSRIAQVAFLFFIFGMWDWWERWLFP